MNANGIQIGKSPRFQRGELKDFSRAIDTQGVNAVVIRGGADNG